MSIHSNYDIVEMEPLDQVEVMRKWFFENFEDPVQILRWDSDEGDFIWMLGGPEYALDVLQWEFGTSVAEDTIDQLAEQLNRICPAWSPIWDYDAEAFQQELIGLIAEDSEYFQKFEIAMQNNLSLLRLDVPEDISSTLYRMIHVNLITTMETYLSDAFIGTVFQSQEFLGKFVKHTPEFQKKTISFSEIYDCLADIDKIAKKYLSEVLWHRLDVVKNMYADTFGVSFPEGRNEIFRAIEQRHIFVHGKADSERQTVTKEDVVKVAHAVEQLILCVDEQLKNLPIQQVDGS